MSLAAGAAVAGPAAAREPERETVVRIVRRIQRADYEGDRAALARHHQALGAFLDNPDLAARVHYWRGFALWRRSINGFNEAVRPPDLEQDLVRAVADFESALARDGGFVDARVGAAACLGLVMFVNQGNPARLQELGARLRPLIQEAQAAEPDNPRLLWVLGPWRWNTPPEQGGGQDKAFELYERGLKAIDQGKGAAADPLRPGWGKPELLMSLAWSNLNRTSPDLEAAERHARAALALVPYWHYVRDILLAQIQQAKAQAKATPPAGTGPLREAEGAPGPGSKPD